eukprot:ctg_1776.g531
MPRGPTTLLRLAVAAAAVAVLVSPRLRGRVMYGLKAAQFLVHGSWAYTRGGFERHARERFRERDWASADLSGRHVLITGANSGIGYCAAESLSRLGACVHLLAARRGRRRLTPLPAPAGRVGTAQRSSIRPRIRGGRVSGAQRAGAQRRRDAAAASAHLRGRRDELCHQRARAVRTHRAAAAAHGHRARWGCARDFRDQRRHAHRVPRGGRSGVRAGDPVRRHAAVQPQQATAGGAGRALRRARLRQGVVPVVSSGLGGHAHSAHLHAQFLSTHPEHAAHAGAGRRHGGVAGRGAAGTAGQWRFLFRPGTGQEAPAAIGYTLLHARRGAVVRAAAGLPAASRTASGACLATRLAGRAKLVQRG